MRDDFQSARTRSSRAKTGARSGEMTAAARLLVLASVFFAAIDMPLTFTGPAVGLPAISAALGGSPVALNWVTNAFMLTFGSTLMAGGALADSFGRRRIFLAGLAVFILFSVSLAFCRDILLFDILRALQGIGAAAAFAGGMASLAQVFDGPARLRAFSVIGAGFGTGLAFGPVASGAMVAQVGWPAIFSLEVAIAAVAFGLGAAFMRESRDPAASGLDWKGAVTFTLSLTLLTFGVLQAPESGWGDPLVILLLVAAVVLMAAFCVIEMRVTRPMLDLSLFRYPRFVGVQLLAAAPAYAFVVLLILLPVRFIGVEGMGEIAGGRMMIALAGPLFVLPIAAGLLTRWFSPAVICGIGLAIAAVGLFWLSVWPAGTAPLHLIAPMLTIGIGISLPWGLMDGLAVSVVPKERAGMATGIFSTTRVAGEGVALAVVTALLSALTGDNLVAVAGERARTIAQRMVTGDVPYAADLLPSHSRAILMQAYGDGFSDLLRILTGITVVTALVVFLVLGRRHGEDEADKGERGEASPDHADPALARQCA